MPGCSCTTPCWQLANDVAGYWLNIPRGGAACPKCGEPQPQVAVELLKMRARLLLCDAMLATRDDVTGYWLIIPGGVAACPKCGEPQPQVAVKLLKMLRGCSCTTQC